ncbi:MAG: AAA family ATPase [Alphaproteobacteria bacterium]|nr:AAA family ATPase [Alphaproteobacteria bacterium]
MSAMPCAASGWAVPWEALAELPWIRAMEGCPQDPHHHAEGDVFIHTRMVLEALTADPAWRALPEPDRALVWLGALLHDVAKPATTRTEPDGRISARGHARVGAVMTRRILWEAGVPFAAREAACGLVRHHLIPYFLIDQSGGERRLMALSQTTRCDLLVRLATADIRGRVCADADAILDNIALFGELAREHGCWDVPRAFPSPHARLRYLQGRLEHPDVDLFDDTRFEVLLMCGLPGAGKDHWLRHHAPSLPVVSLDDVRRELGVAPTDNQGRVRQEAIERARVHLRAECPFAWNATNLSRSRRQPLLQLIEDYGGRARVVYVEPPAARLFNQNRDRDHVVPEPALRAMMRQWEVPDRTEAHRVDYVVADT